MTTNTTNSQATSIDTPEFRELFHACESYLILHDDDDQYRADVTALVAHIDAKLAQVEREAYSKGADDVQAHAEGIINRTVERAKKSESRLAEIQRGVEGLTRYDRGWDGIEIDHDGILIDRDEVLALLQPQGQADTSGLPG